MKIFLLWVRSIHNSVMILSDLNGLEGQTGKLTHFRPVLRFIEKPVICLALQHWFLYEKRHWAEMA